jgi:hypothetical protein
MRYEGNGRESKERKWNGRKEEKRMIGKGIGRIWVVEVEREGMGQGERETCTVLYIE